MTISDAHRDRLQKLINLAEGATNPDEAEAALARIAAMMEKHGIDEEQVRRLRQKEDGGKLSAEQVGTWQFVVDPTGGHVLHRVAALHSVIRAMGADCFYRQVKGQGYHGRTTMTVIAVEATLEHLQVFLPLVSMRMETEAGRVSRQASRESRALGGHHSSAGCFARRGFMRGFGQGIATRINSRRRTVIQEDQSGSTALVLRDRESLVDAYMQEHHSDLRHVKPQRFDAEGFEQGVTAGYAFASPAVTATGHARGSIES